MDLLFDFTWDVANEGYRFAKARITKYMDPPVNIYPKLTKECVCITNGKPWGVAPKITRYKPFESAKSLFLHFSKLDLTEEAICDFASQYGLLSRPQEIMDVATVESYQGEAVLMWENEVVAMKRAVVLWEASKEGRVEFIRSCIVSENQSMLGEQVFKYVDPINYDGISFLSGLMQEERTQEISIESYMYSSAHILEEKPNLLLSSDMSTFKFAIPESCNKEEYTRLALFAAQVIINNKLQLHCYPPQLIFSMTNDKPELNFRPKNLIGAMWLQFARAIDGNKEYRRCAMCPTWMEVGDYTNSPSSYRRSKKYCSNTCKCKAYRRRQSKKKKHNTNDGM